MANKSWLTGSLKQPWDKTKRDRFCRSLYKQKWEVVSRFKNCPRSEDSTLFQKGDFRLEVDDYGAWIFELSRESGAPFWRRTAGISDDLLDDIYLPGHNPDHLWIKTRHLSLATATWVR